MENTAYDKEYKEAPQAQPEYSQAVTGGYQPQAGYYPPPQAGYYPPAAVATDDRRKKAIAFMTWSLICAFAGLFIFGFILGAISIVFGCIALYYAGTAGENVKKGGVIAGSVIGLVLGLVDIIAMIAIIANSTTY